MKNPSALEGFSRRPGYRPRSKRRRQLYIIQGLPGVGRDRAARLLDAFGSVAAVMTAGIEELQVVEGIGPRSAEKIKWAVSEEIPPFAEWDEFPV